MAKEMSPDEFREFGHAAVNFIADYIQNIRDRPVLPSVEPGYMQPLLPSEAPALPEAWQNIMNDLERVIMPGITHWQSPSFHAYFPTANSFPAIVGDIISTGLGVVGFSWMTSPACTELEVIVMEWLGKMLGLPKDFLNSTEGPGGGVIQGSASEATLVALLAAREKTVRRYREEQPHMTEGEVRAKLVAYTSDQSNSSVWKSGLLGAIPMRKLPTDESGSLRGYILEEAVAEDIRNGLIPCCVVATLGTTGTCAFDSLVELGPICNEKKVWLHVDAAYAGAIFVCPEYRHYMAGVELADSFDINPHKWMLVNFDCSTMWVKNANDLESAFNVDAIYLKHNKQGVMPDYRHWQLPLGRRFRSLKLWMVLRSYGVVGVQAHIRRQIGLAKEFESLCREDARFEVPQGACCGLVCFRMRGADQRTKALLERITARKTLYMCPATIGQQAIIRFVVCSRLTNSEDVRKSWEEISTQAGLVLKEEEDEVDVCNGVCKGTCEGSCSTQCTGKTNKIVSMVEAAEEKRHAV